MSNPTWFDLMPASELALVKVAIALAIDKARTGHMPAYASDLELIHKRLADQVIKRQGL